MACLLSVVLRDRYCAYLCTVPLLAASVGDPNTLRCGRRGQVRLPRRWSRPGETLLGEASHDETGWRCPRSSSFHLRQCRLDLRQPERDRHGSIELDSPRERGARTAPAGRSWPTACRG